MVLTVALRSTEAKNTDQCLHDLPAFEEACTLSSCSFTNKGVGYNTAVESSFEQYSLDLAVSDIESQPSLSDLSRQGGREW